MGLQLPQPGPIVTKQGPFKLGKVFPLLENSAAAARWVPAFERVKKSQASLAETNANWRFPVGLQPTDLDPWGSRDLPCHRSRPVKAIAMACPPTQGSCLGAMGPGFRRGSGWMSGK